MFRDRTRSCGLHVPVLLLLMWGVGCNKPSYIELEPSLLELGRRSETRRVNAQAMNHQGRSFPEVGFDWESENPEIATVDERGTVTAVASGSTFVTARARGLESQTRVIVRLIEKLEIMEPEVTLSATQSRRYVPEVLALDHRDRRLTGRRITVESRDEDIVTVDARGGLHAQNPGETEVVVEADGLSGIIRVTVEM